jgi:hypothetical protein
MKSHQETEAISDTILSGNKTGAGPEDKKKKPKHYYIATYLLKVSKPNPCEIALEEENKLFSENTIF